MVTYLSIIGRLLRELGVSLLFVGSGRGGWELQRSAAGVSGDELADK